jgi:hypothetical protein
MVGSRNDAGHPVPARGNLRMSAPAAERISALSEQIAGLIGRRVDRIVGELSDGAAFDTIETPGAEVLATIIAFKRVARDLQTASARAEATHAALLQLEARGADDATVQLAESQAASAAAKQEELLASLERLLSGVRSGRRRSS